MAATAKKARKIELETELNTPRAAGLWIDPRHLPTQLAKTIRSGTPRQQGMKLVDGIRYDEELPTTARFLELADVSLRVETGAKPHRGT